MTELTDLLSTPPASRKDSCRFDAWLKGLSDDERTAVVESMDNPDWPSTQLTIVFRKFGLTSDERAVRLHRKKECAACGPR
jgi:hypothetical protein